MCKRCNWGTKNELMLRYHDEEWGVPLHDDNKLFEFFVLEGFQAGLSWQIVLNKRENFRKAFDNFNPQKVAAYNEEKIQQLIADKSIIRNQQKIRACVNNAQCFLEIQKKYGSFDAYIWKFVDHQPIQNTFETLAELPAKTKLSDAISADLKQHGFKFVGSTVIYAHMQATGMVNDHLVSCFRYKQVRALVDGN
ncbi:DNA-3-methyladenine glycosylase I [uncultured Draconibacterium sp.]|uniref:DNA-3-methyladenine glycosylase I n=1 Tax=uncultured Draconibacterium sp. TaxID=1573823 RepID=UPI0025F11ED1|nr:DNA-3-methyladenine glycosylase I [uncultured Draconibacterium sp.]